jgi:type IV secretion system protein VirD4
VSLSIVLQSLSQLAARYGQDYARSIQGGFNTYLTYAGADQHTAEFFEKIAGKVIEEQRDKIESITSQRREFNLLNADAVRRIDDSKAIMVSTNKNPALLDTQPYFTDRRLSKIPGRFGEAHMSGYRNAMKIERVPLK